MKALTKYDERDLLLELADFFKGMPKYVVQSGNDTIGAEYVPLRFVLKKLGYKSFYRIEREVKRFYIEKYQPTGEEWDAIEEDDENYSPDMWAEVGMIKVKYLSGFESCFERSMWNREIVCVSMQFLMWLAGTKRRSKRFDLFVRASYRQYRVNYDHRCFNIGLCQDVSRGLTIEAAVTRQKNLMVCETILEKVKKDSSLIAYINEKYVDEVKRWIKNRWFMIEEEAKRVMKEEQKRFTILSSAILIL